MQDRLKETFRFFFNNFFGFAFLFMGVALVSTIPLLLFGDSLGVTSSQPPAEGDFSRNMALAGLLVMLIYVFFAGLCSYRFRTLLEGGKGKIGTEMARTSSKFFQLLGVSILSAILFVLGFLLFILPGFYIIIRLSFAYYYVLFNDCSATEAIKQSWEHTKDVQWQLIGGMVVIGLIIIVTQVVVSVIKMADPTNIPLEIGLSVLAEPFAALASIYTLRYYDLVNGTYAVTKSAAVSE